MGRARQMKRLKRALLSMVEERVDADARRGQANDSARLVSVPSRWDERPAAEREHVEQFDNFAHLRNKLAELAPEREEWAGLPMIMEGCRLILEPKYRYQGLSEFGKPEEPDDDDPTIKHRNTFWSTRWRCPIVVYEQNKRAKFFVEPGSGNQATMLLNTLGASDAWGVQQESNALHLLATLVRHHTFKHYLMTGCFLESSPNGSGVSYMFRKLRPTVAMVERKGAMVLLATLCMHPVGYYEGSWAGAMCPTDDVIAHLMLMRADEPKFWARCNQHPPSHPASGL